MNSYLAVALCVGVISGLSASTSAQSAQPASAAAAVESTRPVMLEWNEGELRTRRPRELANASSQFRLKVSPDNNRSQHLVAGTEEILPGAGIPKHLHHGMDEMLLIETGNVHVEVGNQQRKLHPGGLVFIPAETWISLKNIGSEAARVAFVFSAPGFDDYMRCSSVPAGESVAPMTNAEWKRCQDKGHVVYADSR
jgi:quercetin dioxygenase-like cupin family protein